jgi:hypothetical protein
MSKKDFTGNNPALAFINTPKETKLTETKVNKETKKQNNKITTKINVDAQATTKDLIRIATYVPKELKKTFNIIAVQEDRNLYEVINEALIKYIKDKKGLM